MINTVQQNSKFLEKNLALLLSCKCNLYISKDCAISLRRGKSHFKNDYKACTNA